MRIFLIEDDKALAEGISFTLQKEGYETEVYFTCRKAGRRWIPVSRI